MNSNLNRAGKIIFEVRWTTRYNDNDTIHTKHTNASTKTAAKAYRGTATRIMVGASITKVMKAI